MSDFPTFVLISYQTDETFTVTSGRSSKLFLNPPESELGPHYQLLLETKLDEVHFQNEVHF